MSRIEVTELVPGKAATSAAVNATLNAWTTGTAPGSIDETNVRFEGIDRGAMSAAAHVVYTDASGGYTRIIGSSGPSINATGTYAEVPGPLVTDDLTFATDTQIIVHATLFMTGGANATGTTVSLILQVSDDGGTSWADMVGTEQHYSTRDTSDGIVGFTDPAAGYPGIVTSASWSVYFTAAAGQTLTFRVAYQTSNLEAVTFLNGTIFTETFTF